MRRHSLTIHWPNQVMLSGHRLSFLEDIIIYMPSLGVSTMFPGSYMFPGTYVPRTCVPQ